MNLTIIYPFVNGYIVYNQYIMSSNPNKTVIFWSNFRLGNFWGFRNFVLFMGVVGVLFDSGLRLWSGCGCL
jgi:hypothetical protein